MRTQEVVKLTDQLSPVLLAWAQVDIQKLWVFISSVIIASAFVFGNSVKQLFESVIFLFFVHPYDVGDCLLIEGTGAGTGKFFVRPLSHSV